MQEGAAVYVLRRTYLIPESGRGKVSVEYKKMLYKMCSGKKMEAMRKVLGRSREAKGQRKVMFRDKFTEKKTLQKVVRD